MWRLIASRSPARIALEALLRLRVDALVLHAIRMGGRTRSGGSAKSFRGASTFVRRVQGPFIAADDASCLPRRPVERKGSDELPLADVVTGRARPSVKMRVTLNRSQSRPASERVHTESCALARRQRMVLHHFGPAVGDERADHFGVRL
jgi:hypothetical protein